MVTKSDYREEKETRPKAKFKTTLGEFTIELFATECPETVWNFINLAEGRQESTRTGPFYDGLKFHRIIEGFMIQGGCPLGTGTGGPGYRFKDEFDTKLRHDKAGILTMASDGTGTMGSQFFITLARAPHLDGRHTDFRRVIEGMDVIRKLAVATGAMDRPANDVIIEKITIQRMTV